MLFFSVSFNGHERSFQLHGIFTIFRYNGKALIDEDLLRETGVTDFSKYRGHPDHEPSRMMPRQVPSILVDEDDQNNVLAP